MSDPYRISATNDDGDEEYGKSVYASSDDEACNSALNTIEADDESGWTVTVTEEDDDDE